MACQVYSELFSDCTPERMDQLFRYLDKDNTGYIDFLSWSRRIRLQVCAYHCANAGSFAAGWPPDVSAVCCHNGAVVALHCPDTSQSGLGHGRADRGERGLALLLQDVPLMIKNCKAPGPLYVSALSEGELRHLNNMMGRLYQLAEAATAVRARPLSLTCSSTEAHHGLPTWDDIDLLIRVAGIALAS